MESVKRFKALYCIENSFIDHSSRYISYVLFKI